LSRISGLDENGQTRQANDSLSFSTITISLK